MTFTDRVYHIVSTIPRGKVMTYSSIAAALGNPRAGRAVGSALNKNRDFLRVPCHRVVRADGSVGGYVNGASQKCERLRAEGVAISDGRIDLKTYA